MDKIILQQNLERIELEKARLEGEKRMLAHLAKQEGLIDEQGNILATKDVEKKE